MRKLFDLQMFAEEQANETPTENVENTPANEENAEEETPNFDDTSKEETKEETTQNEEEKKNANKENAQRRIAEKKRREQEKREKLEQERKEREAYLKGVKKALGDKNPYTDKPIVDDEDLEEYEIMKKLDEDGKDPISDYPEYVKNKRREQKQKEIDEKKKQQEESEMINRQISEVDKKYGKGASEKYLNDKEFLEFGEDLIDSGVPLLTVVQKYESVLAKINKESTEKAIEKDARRRSSPGSLESDGNIPKKRDWRTMTSEEFKKYFDEIQK